MQHPKTYEYLEPTDSQLEVMTTMRKAADDFAKLIDVNVPDGPDKTYLLRKHRETAMWINVAITRNPDGSPRT